MNLRRWKNFAAKPARERAQTIRFFLRYGLSRVPYLLVPVKLIIPPADRIALWWSCLYMGFHAERRIFDYSGDDLGNVRFLWRFLQPGMTFFDVGAYHGTYTLLAASKLRARGRVVSFEPSPRERRRLRLHLRLNRMSGVRVEGVAVGSHCGSGTLFIILDSAAGLSFGSMNSLMRPRLEQPLTTLRVPVLTLDQYCKQTGIEKVDMIKIDAEGAELEILRGAGKILNVDRPLIVCEVLDGVTEPWGYRARAIISFLEAHGYLWFDFCEDGNLSKHTPRSDYATLKNYFAAPAEKLPLLREFVKA